MADLRWREGRAPPGPTFLHFHAVFGKNWPNNRLALPSGLGAPPLGNPGSATGCDNIFWVSVILSSAQRSTETTLGSLRAANQNHRQFQAHQAKLTVSICIIKCDTDLYFRICMNCQFLVFFPPAFFPFSYPDIAYHIFL